MCKTITSATLLILLAFSGFSEDEDWVRTISLENELKLATTRLVDSPGHVAVAVDGMCCRTCAIGISKKVYRLNFVDPAALTKGVNVDRENGLLTVAIKDGQDLQANPLITAIVRAGYEPGRIYTRDAAGKISVEPIAR
jgi:hypothetical protein